MFSRLVFGVVFTVRTLIISFPRSMKRELPYPSKSRNAFSMPVPMVAAQFVQHPWNSLPNTPHLQYRWAAKRGTSPLTTMMPFNGCHGLRISQCEMLVMADWHINIWFHIAYVMHVTYFGLNMFQVATSVIYIYNTCFSEYDFMNTLQNPNWTWKPTTESKLRSRYHLSKTYTIMTNPIIKIN